jgi:hypothetical protein
VGPEAVALADGAFFADFDMSEACPTEAQGVDQCLIINYPMMLNSDGYIAHLERLVK